MSTTNLIPCRRCDGLGIVTRNVFWANVSMACELCEGSGKVPAPKQDGGSEPTRETRAIDGDTEFVPKPILPPPQQGREPIDGWVNIYAVSNKPPLYIWPTREVADLHSHHTGERIACVHVREVTAPSDSQPQVSAEAMEWLKWIAEKSPSEMTDIIEKIRPGFKDSLLDEVSHAREILAALSARKEGTKP